MAESKKPTTTRKKTTTSEDKPKVAKTKAAAPKAAPSAATAPKKSSPRSKKAVPAAISEEMRQHMIREAAYYRAMHRGFGSGTEMEDWCAAEREIDAMLGKLTT